MVRPPKDMDTENVSFAPHPYVIVAPPDHPLVGRKNIPLEVACRGAVHRPGTRFGHVEFDGRRLRRAAQAELNIAMEITSTETIKQAVIAGMGISFLSAHTISMELQVGRLAVLDIAGFPVMLNWYRRASS